MQLDLKQVFQQEGFVLPIDLTLDLSDEEVYGAKPFTQPVNITGTFENHGSVVMLRYRAEASYTRECDRCLESSSQPMTFTFEHIVSGVEPEDDTSEEIVFAPDYRVEFDEIAREDILLEAPTGYLCKQDCKGLCPKCGCNLNHGQCDCVMSEPDPRLAALRKLLEENQ